MQHVLSGGVDGLKMKKTETAMKCLLDELSGEENYFQDYHSPFVNCKNDIFTRALMSRLDKLIVTTSYCILNET